ncbi:MAG: nucleotide exchange factor GrpE [Blastocatellia bacterium]
MSSKNQSESTATVQEEQDNAAVESTAAVPTEAEAADNTEEATAQASSETIEAEENSAANETAAPEFKVTDKRRFVEEEAAETTATEDGEADDDELPATFEIDLDQLQLDAAAVEREMQELRTKLKESEARRDEAVRASEDYADRFRRAQLQLRAENEEVRARLQRTFEQKLEVARGDVVASLLDTLDNLQRAVAAADTAPEEGAAFIALRDGVRATAEMFEQQLKKMGLQAVASEGEPFNPEVHDAVELAVVPSEQDNQVIAELQRGYKFNDRLLRPARVKVGRAE